MSVCFIPLYTPLLFSKTGVYRGIHYFLIFALKHILWVLVRGGSNVYPEARFTLDMAPGKLDQSGTA